MDLSVPAGTDSEPGNRKQGLYPAGRAAGREAGEYVETPVSAGAERELHAGRAVGGVPVKYVRTDLCVRRGGEEGRIAAGFALISFASWKSGARLRGLNFAEYELIAAERAADGGEFFEGEAAV